MAPIEEFSPRVAWWVRSIRPSPLQRALAASADPAVLSLSLGLPDPELFPTEALSESASRVLRDKKQALQYQMPSEELKTQISRLMHRRGVDCLPESIFLTAGAQQALSLLVRLLLDVGSPILEEDLSYTAFQQAVEPYAPQVFTVACDSRRGINVDALEELLRKGLRPSLLYVMADGHNPMGTTIPKGNRERIASLARGYCLPIIEDDPYGFLSYDGEPVAPIAAIESKWVYYVGSFSKLLAPALRVGWIIVPAQLIRPLSVIKEAFDINMSSFSQFVVADYLETGALPEHITFLQTEYRKRRDAMASALSASFPAGARWQIPSTGVFFWIDLPQTVNTTELLDAAIARARVSFLPAEAFSRGKRLNGMRLNFSRCNCDQITEAIGRIARLL